MIDCSTFLFLNRSTIVRSSGGESPQTHLSVLAGTTYEERAQIQALAPAFARIVPITGKCERTSVQFSTLAFSVRSYESLHPEK